MFFDQLLFAFMDIIEKNAVKFKKKVFTRMKKEKKKKDGSYPFFLNSKFFSKFEKQKKERETKLRLSYHRTIVFFYSLDEKFRISILSRSD